MFKRLMTITGLMLFASASWAQELNKASSFTVEKDALTGVWTLECSAEVSDIDRMGTYRAGVGVSYKLVSGPSSTSSPEEAKIFSTTRNRDLLPSERGVSEFADGLYAYEFKKVGKKLTMSVEANYYGPATVGLDDEGTFRCQVYLTRRSPDTVVVLQNVIMDNALIVYDDY